MDEERSPMSSGSSSLASPPGGVLDRPLPEGVRDLLYADAAAWREMEAALRRTWNAWGYREIILPTFEYADTLATDVGAEIEAETYRFFDRHGRTLALRPDMTIPTARVVGSRLYDQPLPLRIAYVGSVFRYEPPRAGRQHEFTQAGVELIGARGSAADAESVALAVAALQAAALPAFRVTVGHVGFFGGLLVALDLPDRQVAAVRDAVNRKAEAELGNLVREIGSANPQAQAALLALLRLAGDATILAEAERYCLNSQMADALAELRAAADLVAAYGVAGMVNYDLAEVRDLGYYTGITFEGFAPGLGFNLISGGRYDGLVGHFGPPFPAVGWALTLDRVLLAREMQGAAYTEPVPDVLFSSGGHSESLAWAGQARKHGLLVEVDPLGLPAEELWRSAQARGIARIARYRDPRTLLVRDRAGQRQVAVDDWEEVATWRGKR
jgi:ATP phosphoribosyltransferase regulatory subunit